MKEIRLGRWPLPSSWAWATMVEVAKIVGGSTPKNASDPRNFSDDGIPWLTPADLSGYTETYVSRGVRSLSSFGFSNCGAQILPKGTVLFTSRAPIGYCTIARDEICTNQGFKSFVFTSAVRPEYARYYLLGSTGYVRSLSSGTTFQELSGKRAGQILFPLAPRPEQDRIVTKLDELFSRIENGEEHLKRVEALTARYRQAVLKAAVTGALTRDWRARNPRPAESGADLLRRILAARRAAWEAAELEKMKAKGKPPRDDKWKTRYKEPASPDTSDLPELPDGWVWASPDQLSHGNANSLAIGPFGSNLKVSDYRPSGVPLIFVRHIRAKNFVGLDPKFVTHKKAQALLSHVVREGDLLITKMGEPPGECCIYPQSLPDGIITADCIKWTLSPLLVVPRFQEFSINSPIGATQIRKITKGVAQQKINLALFRQIAVPLPPLEEQAQIDLVTQSRLDGVKAIDVVCHKEKKRAQALRGTTLRHAFTGSLTPQDNADEPASALLVRIAAEPKTERRVKPARPADGAKRSRKAKADV